MANDKKKVRAVLDKVKADGRTLLTASEGGKAEFRVVLTM